MGVISYDPHDSPVLDMCEETVSERLRTLPAITQIVLKMELKLQGMLFQRK